ncbi:hypothetical protein KP509_34G018500 [Ceratopteris richardii]|uniref:protein-serine/threonine phosphatase n=1 Tax=Ceratopteris richardii TaxID=49495 RepID=A0A8T2QID5_CERRI|nr:hypothetical protein KP509_34G018500 [Ceratopteris richardii]
MRNILTACLRPIGRHGGRLLEGHEDALLWYKDRMQHTSGDLSIAVVQANLLLEDQTQVKVSPYGTLIGIYDGHGGPEASRFIVNHLFPKIEGFAEEVGGMSSNVLKRAFSQTEEEFLRLVDKSWQCKPQIASTGSCCLVGVVNENTLYIANLGDSRVVLGTVRKDRVEPVRLSKDHNACNIEVREELKSQHPEDSQIVIFKQGVWRVKGIIQVSRSIGDVYLKKPEFSKEPCIALGKLPLSFKKPILSAEPSLQERTLYPEDQFLIFASDGLWELLSDQEAVDIVQRYPRAGIAKRLVRSALQQAAQKREMCYSDLKKIQPGVRRHFHDDISVVVVYLDYNLMNNAGASPKRRFRNLSMNSVNVPLNIFSSKSMRNMALFNRAGMV